MPLQETSGNVTTDAYGGGVAAVPQYIEDVFSTYLYKGTDAALTITNGIDLSTKGGLVWIKNRQQAGYYHVLTDTARGANKQLYSNTTDAQYTTSLDVTSFTTTGFTLGNDNFCNQNNAPNVSWTFRKQPKFFDVVTYSGNSVVNRAMPHNLGSVPGCIIVKTTTAAGESWIVWHRSGTQINSYAAVLDSTAGYNNRGASLWGTTAGTPDMNASTFSLGTNTSVNETGQSYVAYLFAHNAGGFGLTGTDNVISCGSYTGNGSVNGPSINLGYEPQFVIIKQSSGSNNWELYDNMRGVATGGNDALLRPNTSSVEETSDNILSFTATGFQLTNIYSNTNGSGETYIYIAIRRGPMKVPTVGTSVFAPVASSATTGTITSGFPTDMVLSFDRTAGLSSYNRMLQDRLRGNGVILDTSATVAEYSNSSTASFGSNTGVVLNGGSVYSDGFIHEQFRRAPSFFDEVCYTGNGGSGSPITISHNLGVVPELMIVKGRNYAGSYWNVYTAFLGNTQALYLNVTNASTTDSAWGNTTPLSTVFTVGSNDTNNTGKTYVAYLFATCLGVSKVGSYTGNGTTQAIACGFTGGARFVLIKRTDATGGWYIYDTARGMTTLTDPYLFTNTTAAESATLGSVTTVSTGFALNSTILAAINVNGGTYIFLAIA
jgi:hypothetical protein